MQDKEFYHYWFIYSWYFVLNLITDSSMHILGLFPQLKWQICTFQKAEKLTNHRYGGFSLFLMTFPKLNNLKVNMPKLCCTDIFKHTEWNIGKLEKVRIKIMYFKAIWIYLCLNYDANLSEFLSCAVFRGVCTIVKMCGWRWDRFADRERQLKGE